MKKIWSMIRHIGGKPATTPTVVVNSTKVRGYAYEKIEYVKIRAYFSKNKIRVLYILVIMRVCPT